MAFQFNSFSITGITNVIHTSFGSSTLRIYPSTVAFPSSPINTTASLPAGNILSYTGLTLGRTNTTITVTGGGVTQSSTAAGTLAWWALTDSGGNNVIISDSLTLLGGSGLVTVSTLTPTSGQQVTVSVSLTVI